MSTSRRDFLRTSVATAVAAGALSKSAPGQFATSTVVPPEGLESGLPGRDYRPVVTPNGISLPFKIVGGVKVFHLIAEDVLNEFAPGLKAHCWGYNGHVHGPTIEAVEGDRVRIYVSNRLDVSTTVHWHGVLVPSGMDGVGGLSQRPIEPGETFQYEFTLRQHGTLMYHSHHDEMTQMAMGMMGMIVIHPRESMGPQPERDYVYMLSEWKIEPGAARPDPNEMSDFNVITLNAKVFPGTEDLVAKKGDRVRIRIGNLSAMDHHPIHLHGFAFQVIETDGGVIPEGARWPETTVLVPVGSTRTLEFIADEPGDWAMHCHMTHHVMTQMGHGIPNLIGVNPSDFDHGIEKVVPAFSTMGDVESEEDPYIPRNSIPMLGGVGPHGYITMGGMFSILKVRDELNAEGKADPYVDPEGSAVAVAAREDMERDGIKFMKKP